MNSIDLDIFELENEYEVVKLAADEAIAQAWANIKQSGYQHA